MASNVFTGARARFFIDGTVIGYATNCAGSEEIMYEPIDVLDSIETKEFAPVGYRVGFSASRVRLIGSAADSANQASVRTISPNTFPKLGKTAQDLLGNIVGLEDMTCQLQDTVSGLVFMTLERVRIASHNWVLTPRGVVGEDISFVAIRMRDETEQA